MITVTKVSPNKPYHTTRPPIGCKKSCSLIGCFDRESLCLGVQIIFFLCFLSIYTLPAIIDLYQTGIWPNSTIRFFGTIYCATDIAGLLFVPNLSFATKMHHTVVTFCSIANMSVDYGTPGIHRALVFLCYCSMVPYLVNTLLGLRPLGFNKLKRHLSRISAIIYGLSILFNCTYFMHCI